MVDLMMWLVIAALLLAAALQGIAYYQKAAWLYQMKSDASGVGSLVVGKAAQEDGRITKTLAAEAVTEGKWSKDVVPAAEGEERHPYLRATHPGVTEFDVLYLFEDCDNVHKIGVNVVAKGGNPALEACGITSTPTPTPTPTADDIDGDGIPNASDPDIDGDGIPNAEDPTPNGETDPGSGGSTTPEAGSGDTTTPAGSEYALMGWGANGVGQIGDGTTTSVSQPTTIGSMTFSKISANAAHSCGISDGKAYCWGSNHLGRLGIGDSEAELGTYGNGSGITRHSPTAVVASGVLAGKTVTDISAGNSSSCAIADSKVYCWGNNQSAETSGSDDGVPVYGSPVEVNSSGVLAGKSMTSVQVVQSGACALDTDGLAYCWGDSGILGNGAALPSGWSVSEPVAVKMNGKQFTTLTGQEGFFCAIDTTQTASCWGWNTESAMGIQGEHATEPTLIDGLPTGSVTSIAASSYHSCAIAAGQAYCWGGNWSNQIGDGTTTSSAVATPVSTSGALSGVTLTAIEVGGSNSCATDGSNVYCWGIDFGATPSTMGGELAGKSIRELEVGGSHALVLYS